MDATRDERRTVTALFADLVGSTALADRLDPEEIRLIVGEAVARMVRAVEAYGGTVKDLAGDGCLALFGAPIAHEDDPERAVLAGLRISRDIDAYGREVASSWGVDQLRARVGVGTGPVVVGMVGAGSRVEYGAFGDTVNVVARLQAAAEPGQVLVLDSTRRLAADRFDWSGPNELELKGKPEPVTAHVARAPSQRSGELRGSGSSGSSARLVGRQAEMEQLSSAAAALQAGSGSIVVISGEPGIGKSRLVAELRDRLEGGGESAARWVVGRCLSYGEGLPYGPFRDLLRDWLGLSSDEPELRTRISLRRQLESLYGEQALDIYPYLASLLELEVEPDARARLVEQSPEARQYRTWEVVVDLIGRLAVASPLVVVLEDLHWSDPTSIGLLERVLAVADEAAVLLILTHRPERDHPSWHLRELAARDYAHRTLVLDLPALPGEAERELLNGLVGADTLPVHVAERLLEAAEGNPFFLEELVGSLVDAGALVRQGDGLRFDHEMDVEVPPTVGQVINARLDRLGSQTQRVVRAAAVLGRRFDLPLLEGVSDGDGLAEAMRELQRLDLVRESRRWPRPEYQFKHVLIQEAAYGGLLESQRRELHQSAARWLEERYAADPGEVAGLLAHHWQAARDDDRAATYLVMAADRARAEHALDEAIGQYRALLPILERRGQRREMAMVLFKLAIALHFDLRFSEADRAYQEALALWQPVAATEPTATVIVMSDRVPAQIDPPRSYNLNDMQAQMATLGRLVELGPDRVILPSLAEHWTISDDGLRYVFRLREGLHWSDGVPLTAHDAEYGIRRNFDRDAPGISVAMLFAIEGAQDYYHRRTDDPQAIGIRALDDRHIEFRLVVPAPYFLNILNRADAAPHPRHAIEALGEAWTEPSQHVVSGSFRRSDAGPDRAILVLRDDQPQARSGNVRRVEWRRVSPAEAAAAYERDEVDMVQAFGVMGEDEQLQRVAGEDMGITPAASTMFLYFVPSIEPFGDARVRRALAHAVDREALAGVLRGSAMVARGGIVPPALHGHTPDIAPRFDPDLARSVLAEAGVRPAFNLYGMAGSIVDSGLLGTIAKGWSDVLGLSVGVREISREQYLAGELPGPAPVQLSGWTPGYPDPEYFLRLLLHSQAKDNFGGYASDRFDELIEQARRERDVRRRLELFHEADRLAVAEDAVVIPTSYDRYVVFVKPWLSGWWQYGKAWPSFADLVVSERSPRHG
jgi:ABC-type oligopeptide transport system substrate-binding subunit/class 3 adenylate cyclase